METRACVPARLHHLAYCFPVAFAIFARLIVVIWAATPLGAMVAVASKILGVACLRADLAAHGF